MEPEPIKWKLSEVSLCIMTSTNRQELCNKNSEINVEAFVEKIDIYFVLQYFLLIGTDS